MSTRAASSTQELSINEKLSIFKLKKDVAKKENEAPQINCVNLKKVVSAPIKIHVGSTFSRMPADSRKLQMKAPRQSLLSTSTKSGVTFKYAVDDTIIQANVVRQKVFRRDSSSRTRIRLPTSAELKDKLDEYNSLAESAGNDVARSFIAAVPSEVNMKDVQTHALYWLTWIRVEGKSNETEFVAELFSKAKSAVRSLSGVQAILTAELKYLSNIKMTNSFHPGSLGTKSDSTRYSTEHEDEEQSGSDDLRMMLDETRFSFSELSSLESFRSSTGDSIDSNSSTLTVSQQEPKADRSIILTANLKEEEEFPIQSTSKYSNFLKNTQRSELLAENLSMQTSEISSAATLRPGASDYSEGTDQSVSVSSKVAQLESRLSCISPLRSRSAVSVSLAASNAAQLILACRVASGGLSLCTKRKSLKSPGKTNLDRLLGLGNCDNDASESEGEHTNLKKKCLSASTSRVTDPPNVHCSDNTVLQIDDLSGRVSGLLDTLDFSLHAISESGPAARALTGSTDIFSDEDDDTDDDKNSPLPLFPDETQRLARDLTCSTSGDVTAKERSDISSLVLASPTSRSAAVASESMILVPRSRGRAAVTFSESELSGVQHTESLIQSHPQHEADSTGHALINSELTNGYRRSSRLFRNTMNLSASKNGSNSSNRTSLGSSRFVSTESSQSGKVSMDVMRNDCGYDSYFGSMEFAAQFGDDGNELDLRANTPAKGDRRSRRQSMSTGRK